MKGIRTFIILITLIQILYPGGVSACSDSLFVALLEYRNDELGLSFKYPEYWGKLIFEDHRNDTAKCYMLKAAGADYWIHFDEVHKFYYLNIYISKKGPGSPYRYICYESDSWKIDMLAKEQEVEEDYDLLISGHKAKGRDYYFEPGETLYRSLFFFTRDYMIEIKFGIRLIPLKYKCMKCPLWLLVKMNKDNERIYRFYKDVLSFIDSLRI